MTCIGWKKPKDCREEQVVKAGATATCPDITWFWLGAAGVFLAAIMKK